MKRYRKLFAIVLTGICVFYLTACGGSGGRADSEYTGKYIAVTGEALGVTVTGDDVSGFSLELKENGKGTITVDGDSGSCKWTNDDTTLTLTADGEEMVASLGENTLTFDDLLNMGLKLTFAKEGTDAANPENYLPEQDKNMIGVWKSHKVTGVLGDDASEEVDPEAITIEFFSDHTAKATMSDTDLGEGKWSFVGDSGYFDGDYLLSNWSRTGDEIELVYSDDDNYWVFTCTKQ